MIYVGKSYTATLTGSRVVDVCCEQCKADFVYTLIRQSVGSASAPYYIGAWSGPARAEKDAAKKLAKRLANEQELVPCPKCGWINESVIAGYRKTRYQGWVTAGVVLAIALFFVVMLSFTLQPRFAPGRDLPWAFLAGLVAAAIAVVPPILIQRWLRGRIQPNRMYPQRPTVPEGTPQGRLKRDLATAVALPADADGEVPLDAPQLVDDPIDDDRYAPVDPATTAYPDWVVFRAGELDIPLDVCCECLGPASRRLKQWMPLNDTSDSIQPPVCDECAARIRATRLAWAAGATAINAMVAAGIYFAVRGDEVGRLILAIIAFGAGLLVSLVLIPNFVAQPYSLRTVDKARSVFRIRFRGEQYTEVLRKSVQRQQRRMLAPAAPPHRQRTLDYHDAARE